MVFGELFSELKEEKYLLNYDRDTFCKRAGYYFAAINTIHPFREGNGRTQRVLIDQLVAKSGYAINWSAISGFSIAEASAAALAGDKAGNGLAKLVKNNLKAL
ncbi:Fic family protein [uncultured Microbulbifer sp.]|uniref:Fic family protein n=1 Tax=uncultured Microbulbifer sp. TaxID=348147 RepID=UPI00344EFDF1